MNTKDFIQTFFVVLVQNVCMGFVKSLINAFVTKLGLVQHVINVSNLLVALMEIAMGSKTHALVLKAGEDIYVLNQYVPLGAISQMPFAQKYVKVWIF